MSEEYRKIMDEEMLAIIDEHKFNRQLSLVELDNYILERVYDKILDDVRKKLAYYEKELMHVQSYVERLNGYPSGTAMLTRREKEVFRQVFNLRWKEVYRSFLRDLINEVNNRKGPQEPATVEYLKSEEFWKKAKDVVYEVGYKERLLDYRTSGHPLQNAAPVMSPVPPEKIPNTGIVVVPDQNMPRSILRSIRDWLGL